MFTGIWNIWCGDGNDRTNFVCKLQQFRKGSNKVGKWKSCHQEREIEHVGVTMAFVVTCSGDREKKKVKKLNY
jgi:hypothetical protein